MVENTNLDLDGIIEQLLSIIDVKVASGIDNINFGFYP